MSSGAGGSVQKARLGRCGVLASRREAQQAGPGARRMQGHGLYPGLILQQCGDTGTGQVPAVQFLQLCLL